ncbi:MAG: hypothetical protein RLZZ324_1270 [Candidatus Parcubacteria bacterium]|jgi:hypothetical protein
MPRLFALSLISLILLAGCASAPPVRTAAQDKTFYAIVRADTWSCQGTITLGIELPGSGWTSVPYAETEKSFPGASGFRDTENGTRVIFLPVQERSSKLDRTLQDLLPVGATMDGPVTRGVQEASVHFHRTNDGVTIYGWARLWTVAMFMSSVGPHAGIVDMLAVVESPASDARAIAPSSEALKQVSVEETACP